ncbi:MAG: hypothetical protein ACI8PT_003060 [Gammaproteobacteria bacterium]|jgi:hypothetical protein
MHDYFPDNVYRQWPEFVYRMPPTNQRDGVNVATDTRQCCAARPLNSLVVV